MFCLYADGTIFQHSTGKTTNVLDVINKSNHSKKITINNPFFENFELFRDENTQCGDLFCELTSKLNTIICATFFNFNSIFWCKYVNLRDTQLTTLTVCGPSYEDILFFNVFQKLPDTLCDLTLRNIDSNPWPWLNEFNITTLTIRSVEQLITWKSFYQESKCDKYALTRLNVHHITEEQAFFVCLLFPRISHINATIYCMPAFKLWKTQLSHFTIKNKDDILFRVTQLLCIRKLCMDMRHMNHMRRRDGVEIIEWLMFSAPVWVLNCVVLQTI